MRSNLKTSRQELFHIVLLLFVLCSICTLTARARPQDEQHIAKPQPTDVVQSPDHVTLQFGAEPTVADDQPAARTFQRPFPLRKLQRKKKNRKTHFRCTALPARFRLRL